MFLLLLACAAPEEGPVSLPDEDSAATLHDSSVPVPLDTAPDTGLDQIPEHRLYLHQEGRLELSPFDGPYTHLVGELWSWEHLDEPRSLPDSSDSAEPEEPGLRCETRWTLVGSASEVLGPDCEFSFDVQFHLLEGDRGSCLDPDLPEHEEVLRFSYDEDTHTLFHDLGGHGLWLPWWTATQAGDALVFSYDASMGVLVEEER